MHKTKIKKISIEIFGWYGMVTVLSAYFLNNLQILSSDDLTYNLLNATGAIGIAVSSYSKKDFQPTVINIIWFLIAVFQLLK